MRLTSVLSYSLPASILLTLAACGDSGSGPAPGEGAKFSSASDTQRQRAIFAGSGADSAMAFLVASFATIGDQTSTCPTVVKTGDTVTATFNCTQDGGERVDGVIIGKNLPPLFGEPSDYDPTKDSVIELDGYYMHDALPSAEIKLDGLLTARPDASLDVALTATFMGLTVHTDAVFGLADGKTVAEPGSSIELEGLGSATIGGAWITDSEDPAGALELKGADLMRADFGATAGGCVPLTIDGRAAGELCNGQSE